MLLSSNDPVDWFCGMYWFLLLVPDSTMMHDDFPHNFMSYLLCLRVGVFAAACDIRDSRGGNGGRLRGMCGLCIMCIGLLLLVVVVPDSTMMHDGSPHNVMSYLMCLRVGVFAVALDIRDSHGGNGGCLRGMCGFCIMCIGLLLLVVVIPDSTRRARRSVIMFVSPAVPRGRWRRTQWARPRIENAGRATVICWAW